MRTDRTFTMIKPDAVENGYAGEILDKIIKAGYKIVAFKYTQLSQKEAEGFYAVHADKPFFTELTKFMSSGPIYAAILQKENAIKDFRSFIGATNPAEAAEGTVRKLYATSLGKNAIHGSDSDENALLEGGYFFSKLEEIE